MLFRSAETEAAVPVLFATKGTCYLRLGRGNEPWAHEKGTVPEWTFPRAIRLREGKDIALLSAGGILAELKRAAERLEERGISAEVWSFPCLKPLDGKTVLALAERFPDLITVEEHTTVGGFGSAVCEALAESGSGCRVHRMGLRDCFASAVGDQAYLRHIYGIDGEAIAEKAAALVNGKESDAGRNT